MQSGDTAKQALVLTFFDNVVVYLVTGNDTLCEIASGLMNHAFRNFLWPTSIAPAPRLLQRIGRVLHWFIVAISPLMFVAVQASMGDVAPALVAGALVIVTGRAVRYILSAE